MNSHESIAIPTRATRIFPLMEAYGFAALVAWFIWQLQEDYRYSWIVFPIWLIASFLLNKDTPQTLGWRADNLWSATKRATLVFLPCALAIVAV